jgi:hypothetical protein
MDCRGSLIYARLELPGLDPNEIHLGQMATLLVTLSVLLLTHLLVWAAF